MNQIYLNIALSLFAIYCIHRAIKNAHELKQENDITDPSMRSNVEKSITAFGCYRDLSDSTSKD